MSYRSLEWKMSCSNFFHRQKYLFWYVKRVPNMNCLELKRFRIRSSAYLIAKYLFCVFQSALFQATWWNMLLKYMLVSMIASRKESSDNLSFNRVDMEFSFIFLIHGLSRSINKGSRFRAIQIKPFLNLVEIIEMKYEF